MKKRTATTTLSSENDIPRRTKTLRKSEPRPDAAPKWLHDAAALFVKNTPALQWTESFYSWATWLDDLRAIRYWTSPSIHEKPAWRALIAACKASGQVRGTAPLYRAKSDLVAVIINSVFRLGEAKRVTHQGETMAAERDVMRRVRAVVTRQRRHEAVALTLIRFLDFAFVLSAYKDCRLAQAVIQRVNPSEVDLRVEKEVTFFNAKPNAKEIRAVTRRMEQFMWNQRWLPWYEQVPGVRDEMVIHAREAALSFCEGLPFPKVRIGTGVRGLSRDHLAGAGSMDEWLITLLDSRLVRRWGRLSAVYEMAMRDERGEEDALLEETSRRVLQTVLEPLIEVRDGSDTAQSKLVDAAPGIVVTQSVRIPGRFTFRQLLELYIHLSMFGQCLQTRFLQQSLPSVEEIRSGVVLYEEIKSRALELRGMIDSDKMDLLMDWCLATQEVHVPLHNAKNSLAYQHAAVKAALGSAMVRYSANPRLAGPKSGNPNFPCPDMDDVTRDPLSCAATVAEWDPELGAKIIDAAVRIDSGTKEGFLKGNLEGIDLYCYRRMIVCENAKQRFGNDIFAAARLMTRLFPVWNVCEKDKGIGRITSKGLITLQSAADRGNFEACAIYGVILGSCEWYRKRRELGLQTNVETGISYIWKAVSMGDFGAAIDLVQLLKSTPRAEGEKAWNIPRHLVQHSLQCLKDAAREEPSLQLVIGYLHATGTPYIPVDYKISARSYQAVLESNCSSTMIQACAANNIGVLQSLNLTGGPANTMRAIDYVKSAATAQNRVAKSNLGALLCLESANSHQILESARQTYWKYFEATNCSSPVTVVQRNSRANETNVFEMIIDSREKGRFCRDLRPDGMHLETYGTILRSESYTSSALSAVEPNGRV